jgi:hypothetical protein
MCGNNTGMMGMAMSALDKSLGAKGALVGGMGGGILGVLMKAQKSGVVKPVSKQTNAGTPKPANTPAAALSPTSSISQQVVDLKAPVPDIPKTPKRPKPNFKNGIGQKRASLRNRGSLQIIPNAQLGAGDTSRSGIGVNLDY